MKKILCVVMFPTRILQHPGGPALQKHGGRLLRLMIFGWVVLFGLDLIIVVNRRLINGRISVRILELWTCVAFQKTFITTIKAGGQIRMYCISLLTGIGKARKGSPLMFG